MGGWLATGFVSIRQFEEMALIFCTVDILFDIIGQHMQEHVTSNNLSE